MSEMRSRRRGLGRPGRRTPARIAACSAALVAAALPATASPVATPEPTLPVPVRTLAPVPGSPFEEVVGGAGLAITGAPVVPDGVAPPPAVDATAWLVADLDSGRVLGALSPHDRQPPASTIKLLTALAVLPTIDAAATYTATDADAAMEGSRVGLVPGQRYTRNDLVHGLLLSSGNDAANALAELAGGQPRALALMGDEARRLGAFDTTATTTDGLDDPPQHSSAYDLALMAGAVLADADLATVVRTPAYDFPGLTGETFQIQNQNRLLGSYEGTLGLKTGFTTLAGHTLVAAAERGVVRLVCVVLGAEDRAEPVAGTLLDWGFAVPDDADAVGTLVTPEDVAAARTQADDQPPEGSAAPPAGIEPATGATVPGWAWASLLALPAAVLALAWRRRRPTSRCTERA